MEDDAKMLRSILEEHAYELTFRQIKEKTDIPKSTVQRWMKWNKWRQVAKGTRPYLTDENMQGRLRWAQENKDNDWLDHVDLDEKWFYVWSNRVKHKLPPGVKRIKSPIKSKRYIGKIMQLTAIARPRPEHKFDGLVGCWRVCERRPALRGDSRTGLKKGDLLTEDKNMDGPRFEKMLREDVIPAIRTKMKWAKVVTLQFDNAPGHHSPHARQKRRRDDSNRQEACRRAQGAAQRAAQADWPGDHFCFPHEGLQTSTRLIIPAGSARI
eukprot:5744968-Prymnesium_polylepis.3